MSASFPGSVKSFTTRSDGPGNTIAAAHMNDVQDEIHAIEDAIVNGPLPIHGVSYTWPSADGSAGQVLATNGSGTLSWSASLGVGTCDGRLTLTSGTPITTSDVTGAGTLYFTPYKGNRVALYDGTTWAVYTFTERSLALSLTSGKPYDIFLYNNAGTLTLESLVWTDDTNRATALTTQDGVYVKSGATTRRYLGTIYASGANTTEDSLTKRYVWNLYNQVPRPLARPESTANWTYSTATIRQANGSGSNQVNVVVGISGASPIDLTLLGMPVVNNSGGNTIVNIGIGEDSTSSFAVESYANMTGSASFIAFIQGCRLVKSVSAGRHFYSWNEYSSANATTTWYGATSLGGGVVTTGLVGSIIG